MENLQYEAVLIQGEKLKELANNQDVDRQVTHQILGGMQSMIGEIQCYLDQNSNKYEPRYKPFNHGPGNHQLNQGKSKDR